VRLAANPTGTALAPDHTSLLGGVQMFYTYQLLLPWYHPGGAMQPACRVQIVASRAAVSESEVFFLARSED